MFLPGRRFGKTVAVALLACLVPLSTTIPATASTASANKIPAPAVLTKQLVEKYDRYVVKKPQGVFNAVIPAALRASDPAGTAAVMSAVSTANKTMASASYILAASTPSAKTDWHWWGYTRELDRYYTLDASWTLEHVAGGFAICSGATFFLPPVAGACGIEAGSYWIMGNDAGQYYSHGHCININMTWVSAWWDNEIGYRQGICY